jgi:hypothetical protein
MKKIIAHNDKDGNLCLTISTEEFAKSPEEVAKHVGALPGYLILDHSEISNQDPEFSAAWKLGSESIEVDLNKAKNIWKDKWRAVRKAKLEALDIEFMRATETQNSKEISRIAKLKQALRDVTATSIPATTTEEIKAVWPEILN